jgi:hypothetical protein
VLHRTKGSQFMLCSHGVKYTQRMGAGQARFL